LAEINKKGKDKTTGTVARPMFLWRYRRYYNKITVQKPPRGNLTGFEKFEGKIDGFIVEG
jgi:hypothetical protein